MGNMYESEQMPAREFLFGVNRDLVLVSLRTPKQARNAGNDLVYGMCALIWDPERAVEKVNCRKRCCFETHISLITLEDDNLIAMHSSSSSASANSNKDENAIADHEQSVQTDAHMSSMYYDHEHGGNDHYYIQRRARKQFQYLDSDYSTDCDSSSMYCRRRNRVLRRRQEMSDLRRETGKLKAQAALAVGLMFRGVCSSSLPP
jgi:hypothetical protein